MLVKDGSIEALKKFEYIVMDASRDQLDRVDRNPVEHATTVSAEI